MNLAPNIHGFDSSNRATAIVVNIKQLYKAIIATLNYDIRKDINKILSTILALILMPLAIFSLVGIFIIVQFLLRYLLHKVKRSNKKNAATDFSITTENYKQWRLIADKLATDVNLLKSFKRASLDKVPWHFRWFISLGKKFATQQIVMHDNLNKSLNAFDKGAKSGDMFKHVSSDELWKNRIKAYEYSL
ncbi:MAG: hypothetical protein AAF798_05745 [Bacteroidota bacterium]